MEYVDKSMLKAGAELIAEKDKFISELIDALHMWRIHHPQCLMCSSVTDEVLRGELPYSAKD